MSASPLAAFALAVVTAAAYAQNTPAAPPAKPALEGYQPFADPKPLPWRDANDNVRRIGGWRAYAKEAAAPASAASQPAKAAP